MKGDAMTRLVIRRRILAPLAIALAALCGGSLAACSTSSGGDNAAQTQQQDGTQCFQQLSPADAQKVRDYAASNGDSTQTSTSNDVSDVCVIEGNEVHYYNQQDHFGDYLLYSMLFGNAHAFATVGLLDGDISPFEAIMLTSLVGVNDNGSIYHPYGYQAGGWVRQSSTTIVNNYHVTNVQYGHASPTGFSASKLTKPPTGYRSVQVPASNGKQATFRKGSANPVIAPINANTAKRYGMKLSTAKANPGATARPRSGATNAPKPAGNKAPAAPVRQQPAPVRVNIPAPRRA